MEKKVWFQILIGFFLGLIPTSCNLNSTKKDSTEQLKNVYDGFAEPNSFSPEDFKGRFYFYVKVFVSGKNNITIESKSENLNTLQNLLNEKWEKIVQDDYQASLNIVLISNASETDFEFYMKIYNLVNDFKKNKQNEYSKNVFGNEFSSLDKSSKSIVYKNASIYISELTPGELELIKE